MSKRSRIAYKRKKCRFRDKFPSEAAVNKFLDKKRKTDMVIDGVQVYKCTICAGWHFSLSSKQLERAKNQSYDIVYEF